MSVIDLGIYRANNNVVIPLPGYNTSTYISSTFELVEGNIPNGTKLDFNTGYIHGYISYQPAYIKEYKFEIFVTETDKNTNEVIGTTISSYSLSVKGEVENTIEWVTASNLGTIETGIVSELGVVARPLYSEYTIKYALTSGKLPPGLTLTTDGSISGRVDYGTTGTTVFTVLAKDVYGLSAVSREFNLTVTPETTSTQYTEIYYRPFLSLEKRRAYQTFVSNTFTFDPKLLYRYYDPNFGVQHNIKMVLEFGIERVDLEQYVPALSQNFYRKRIYFGDIKTAVARDSTGTVVYEVVYVDAVDNASGVPMSITSVGVTYYPASIENQRTRLQQLTLDDGSSIGINEYNQPVYMRTAQSGSYLPPYYMSVIPICYALPGQGTRIASRIRLSGFDFKLLDFEVNRVIVEKSKDSSSAKYLIFPRQHISDVIAADDNILYGGDTIWGSWDNNPLEI
jgi:hypothetical protein